MAWTEVDAAPTFGSLLTPSGIFVDFNIRDRILETTMMNEPVLRTLVEWYDCQDGIIGIPTDTAEPSGELTFTGGGGGPVRPTSGFLYPRGDN